MERFVLGIINKARSEGWKSRDKETGTTYEVGYYDYRDEEDELAEGESYYDQVWHKHHDTKSYRDASDTAQRWGCDWRAIRINLFE